MTTQTVAQIEPRLERYLKTLPETFQVTALAGDASTRRYFRMRGGGSSRVVALYPEPFVDGELPFVVVRGLLSGFGIPVPAILDEVGALGVIVQQDLGDLTLQETLREARAPEVEELYRAALGDLVRMQQESARAPQREACFQVAFDIEKLSWELHYFEKHFLEGLREVDLSVEDRSTLGEAFHRLAEEIASWPRVLCHRDFHSRNLMVHAGALYWIDFQDARMGPATYDLVSLVRDSYVELPPGLAAALVEEFRQRAVPRESKDVFERRFDLMAVQRNLKALGTFGYMATVRRNSVYLQHVPRTLGYLRTNLARHPDLGALRRVLARHLEELR